MPNGFSVGNGWYPLIDVLSELLAKQQIDIAAVQVKEKFGALRFYINIIRSEENSDFIGGLCYMQSSCRWLFAMNVGKEGELAGGGLYMYSLY